MKARPVRAIEHRVANLAETDCALSAQLDQIAMLAVAREDRRDDRDVASALPFDRPMICFRGGGWGWSCRGAAVELSSADFSDGLGTGGVFMG
jgi:hypothetical protein